MFLSRVTGWIALAILSQVAVLANGQCSGYGYVDCTATDTECFSDSSETGKCAWSGPMIGVQCIDPTPTTNTDSCGTGSCACHLGMCLNSDKSDTCVPDVDSSDCATGDFVCGDPHMVGLAGQKIDWWGEDGAWYSLLKDKDADLSVNVRLTAPLPVDFPTRQLITGVSVISQGSSIVVENTDPYSAEPAGCPEGATTPCLSNGGLTVTVNGKIAPELTAPVKDAALGGMTVSSSNLPVECRQFGGDRVWARMFEEMTEGRRKLQSENFGDWVLRYDEVAAPEWCAKYINEHDLDEVQSVHSIFRVETPSVTVRLNAGVNQQGDGEIASDGREVPDLEFWQMDIGFEGLDASRYMTGVLGETARPVVNIWGDVVMEGMDGIRGAVSDYRVSGPLSVEFTMDKSPQ